VADIGNGTGLWPLMSVVRIHSGTPFSPCTPMIKIYLTECPLCHKVFQINETHYYAFNPCIDFQCPYCSRNYMLITNALDCLVCSGSWCEKQKKDVVLESSGCMSEKVY
jgi:hypothetical protein